MGDLISRQMTIDEMETWLFNLEDKRTVGEVIGELPSAQPPVLTCDGCRHVGTYDTDFPCSGCIRREKDYYEQE